MKTATTIAAADVDLETRLQCAELWEKVWPSAQDSQDLEARLERVATAYAAQEQQQWHLGIDDHRVVAVARTFHHTVTVGPTSTAVLALASVCSDPAVRGDGWGTAVAAASLKRSIDEGLPCLFQTGVPDFYGRFGAVLLNNEIITSVPNTEPFDDPFAMVYPATTSWPANSVVDLLGNGW